MSDAFEVSREEVEALYDRLDAEAEEGGYHLNPDTEFTQELVLGLIVNERRYGYRACPCRLATGNRTDDLDIICPCDYRDPDLNDFDTCYCGLYVSRAVLDHEKKVKRIPERRPVSKEEDETREQAAFEGNVSLSYPVWRCRVCGYLCARDNPPGTCPVCKAERDRFERFI